MFDIIGFAFLAVMLIWIAASYVEDIPEDLYEAVKFTLWAGFFGCFAIHFYGDPQRLWIFYLDASMFVLDGGIAAYWWVRYFDASDPEEETLTVKEGTEGAWNYHLAEKDSTRSLCGDRVMTCALDLDDWNQSYTSTVESVYCEQCNQIKNEVRN